MPTQYCAGKSCKFIALAVGVGLVVLTACTKISSAPNALTLGATVTPPGSSAVPTAAPAAQWQLVQQNLPGALLSVWGTSATDVYAVGADGKDGQGPLV